MPRPESLDPTKRQKILAIVANGSSRRIAARIVGCSPSTITRAARRDPAFAADLAAAEHNLEVELLRQIRKVAIDGRHWRAAAWLIERKNPRDFAPRRPIVIDEQQLAQSLLHVFNPWLQTLPEAQIDEFFQRLDRFIAGCQKHLPDPQSPARRAPSSHDERPLSAHRPPTSPGAPAPIRPLNR